jgi:uncharacterized protein YndB with AHSA1/START domain
MDQLKLSVTLKATPEKLYNAWLDSASHAAFTENPADVSATVGGTFTVWNGYISGTNLELEPGKRILQNWRTTEFDDNDPDSKLELRFNPAPEGCELVMHHWDIPEGQGKMYEQGWEDFYFEPMRRWLKG